MELTHEKDNNNKNSFLNQYQTYDDKNNICNNIEVIPHPIECIKSELILPQFLSMSEELVCSICLDIVWEPISCKVCTSPFGSKCLNNWFKYNKKCPKQCEYEPAEFSLLLKRLVNKIQFYCLYKTDGCQEVINYDNFYKHINSCPYAEYRCKSPNCNAKGTKKEMEDHVAVCETYERKCDICRLSLKNLEFLNHKNNPELCQKECIKVFERLEEENKRLANKNAELAKSLEKLLMKNEELTNDKNNNDKLIEIKDLNNNNNDDKFEQESIFCSHKIKLKSNILETYTCKICSKKINLGWKCKTCKTSVCTVCFENKYPNTIVQCKKGHYLAAKHKTVLGKYMCDRCSLEILANSTFRCEACDYDLCFGCYKSDLKKSNKCILF